VSVSSKIASTSEKVMVSVAVSKTGKTKVHFIDKGTKVDGRYCRETLLQNYLSAVRRGVCFPAGWHSVALGEVNRVNVPNFIEPSLWPSNSLGINSIMLSGVLCSKMCIKFRSWVWRVSKTVHTCWASLDQ